MRCIGVAAAQLARALVVCCVVHAHGRCLVGKCVFSFLAVAGAQLGGASALACLVSDSSGCSVGAWTSRL